MSPADVQVDQISGTPQLLITVDRHAIARYGISVEDVQKTIQAAVGGATAGQLSEGIRRYDILVRYHEEHRSTPERIGDLQFGGASPGVPGDTYAMPPQLSTIIDSCWIVLNLPKMN